MAESESESEVREMRAEYEFSGGVRGKYADRYAAGTNVVVLDPDPAEATAIQRSAFADIADGASPFALGARPVSDYTTNIFYSAEDGGYIADIPDLVACSAFGATPEEALAEVEKAKTAWLEAAREQGKPIPAPTYRPVAPE